MLVYYERHDTALGAIQREKNIKHWSREWKIDLILSMNPEWRDLYDEITKQSCVSAGHSRSKNGVASLAYDPAIHHFSKRWITGSRRCAPAR